MNFNDFYKDISAYPTDKILFVGLGNRLRGDDGAGLVLLNRLRRNEKLKDANFLEAGTNPENYLQKILDLKSCLVIFIDAAQNNQFAGTISWLHNESVDTAAISTHAFSIRMIEDYLKSEDPSLNFKYLIIEPENFDISEKLSQSVFNGINSFLNSEQN